MPSRLRVQGWTGVWKYDNHPRDITLLVGAPPDLPLVLYRVGRSVFLALPDALADAYECDRQTSSIPRSLQRLARLRAVVGDAGLQVLLTVPGSVVAAMASALETPWPP